jgi:hypothetical protein
MLICVILLLIGHKRASREKWLLFSRDAPEPGGAQRWPGKPGCAPPGSDGSSGVSFGDCSLLGIGDQNLRSHTLHNGFNPGFEHFASCEQEHLTFDEANRSGSSHALLQRLVGQVKNAYASPTVMQAPRDELLRSSAVET